MPHAIGGLHPHQQSQEPSISSKRASSRDHSSFGELYNYLYYRSLYTARHPHSGMNMRMSIPLQGREHKMCQGRSEMPTQVEAESRCPMRFFMLFTPSNDHPRHSEDTAASNNKC